MQDNKFEIGKQYRASTLDGSIIYYSVCDRSEHTVTMREYWINNDNIEIEDINKYDIDIECGIEKICIWEYKNHAAYIYANEGR